MTDQFANPLEPLPGRAARADLPNHHLLIINGGAAERYL